MFWRKGDQHLPIEVAESDVVSYERLMPLAGKPMFCDTILFHHWNYGADAGFDLLEGALGLLKTAPFGRNDV